MADKNCPFCDELKNAKEIDAFIKTVGEILRIQKPSIK